MVRHQPIESLSATELVAETTEFGRVYTTPEGHRYPSITTVLGSRDHSGLDEWRKRVGEEEAARVGHHAGYRGTVVHDLMERYVRGENIDERKLMPHHRRSYRLLRRILDEGLDEWYAQEIALYSDYLKVAGRVDLIGKYKGKISIIDFKTSAKRKKKEWIDGYFIQTAAYAIMFEERTGIPIENLVIIMDIDNHVPEVFEENRDNWTGELIRTIEDYYSEAPKELSLC